MEQKKKRNKPRHPERQEYQQREEDLRLLRERLRQEPPGLGGYAALAAASAVWRDAAEKWRLFSPDRETWLAHMEAKERYEAAIKNGFPDSFRESVSRLQVGDASGMEDIVAFLEVDPIYAGAGFQKEVLIRLLRDLEINDEYVPRLQSAVLTVVDRRHWRDFRDFCRLAKKVDNANLREQLTRRLDSDDPNVSRRARWVLEALAQKGSMEQGRKDAAARKQQRAAKPKDATE